jgi:hypothetical protein
MVVLWMYVLFMAHSIARRLPRGYIPQQWELF